MTRDPNPAVTVTPSRSSSRRSTGSSSSASCTTPRAERVRAEPSTRSPRDRHEIATRSPRDRHEIVGAGRPVWARVGQWASDMYMPSGLLSPPHATKRPTRSRDACMESWRVGGHQVMACRTDAFRSSARERMAARPPRQAPCSQAAAAWAAPEISSAPACRAARLQAPSRGGPSADIKRFVQ